MKQISVALRNEPGALAGVCDALARSGINIYSLYGQGMDGRGEVAIVTHDENTATRVLQEAGYIPKADEIIIIKVGDQPGEFAKITKKLARERVNIEAVYLLNRGQGFAELALKVSNPNAAKIALK